MRKLSIVLMTAAGLALGAGTAATPAVAEAILGPYYVAPDGDNKNPYYGHKNSPHYAPHGPTSTPGVTLSTTPKADPYSARYERHNFPGYYGR